MKIASVADVRAHLSSYLKASEAGPVVVTRNGKAVAVLLAVRDDDEREDLGLAHSPRFQAILETSRRQIRAGQTLSPEDFWAATGTPREKPPVLESGKVSGKARRARKK